MSFGSRQESMSQKDFSNRIVRDFQAESGTKDRQPIPIHHHVRNNATIDSVEEAEAVAGRLVAASRRDMNRAGATAHLVR